MYYTMKIDKYQLKILSEFLITFIVFLGRSNYIVTSDMKQYELGAE